MQFLVEEDINDLLIRVLVEECSKISTVVKSLINDWIKKIYEK